MSVIEIGRWVSYLGLLLMILSGVWICTKAIFRISPFQYFSWYLILSILINLPAFVLAYNLKNNLPLLHLFTLVELLLVGLFFAEVLGLKTNQKYKWLLAAMIGLVVFNTMFIQNIFTYNSYSKTLSQVFLLGMTVIYFFKIDQTKERVAPKYLVPLNIILGSLLVYFAGSIFIFMSSSFLITNADVLNKLWLVNGFLSLFFQILIFYSLWIIVYPRIPSS